MAGQVLQFGIVPATDLRQDQIHRPWGEAAVRRPLRNPGRTHKEGCGLGGHIAGALAFQVVGKRQPGVIGQENGPLGVALPLDTGDPSLSRLPKCRRGMWVHLLEVEANEFFSA